MHLKPQYIDMCRIPLPAPKGVFVYILHKNAFIFECFLLILLNRFYYFTLFFNVFCFFVPRAVPDCSHNYGVDKLEKIC